MIFKNLERDLVIIGAGPAGTLAGLEATNEDSDISVIIFEEHSQVGSPPHCSGLFSLEGFRSLGLDMTEIKKRLNFNVVSKAKFIGPDNNFVEIDRGPDSMIVLDRVALDQYLAEQVQKHNCDLKLKHRIKRIHFDGNYWNLFLGRGSKKTKFRCKILISAEGVHAKLTSSIGLPIPTRNWLFSALQFEFEGIQDIESDCVELYFGRKYAPGFFGWFIPTGDDSARLGIAVAPWFSVKTRFLMNHFIKKHPLIQNRLRKSKFMNSYGGFIPATGPVKKTYSINFMTVGDAAGQSKATTGGGVNIGGYCGRLAGKMAQEIIQSEISATQGCREYQQRWQARFEPDLTLMKLLRRMMTPLPDKAWNKIIHIAKETDIGGSLASTRVDLHGTGLLKYALTPRVFIKSIDLIPQAAVSLLRALTL